MERVDDEKTMLTVPEAAKLLRIGRNHAYELVARGEIPSVRLGRLIRIPRAALEREMGALGGDDAPGQA
ncbi:MAG: helix-turn-helix domain-containing protein [Dehalococcoidia bacterium]